jgi:hypothetical protein
MLDVTAVMEFGKAIGRLEDRMNHFIEEMEGRLARLENGRPKKMAQGNLPLPDDTPQSSSSPSEVPWEFEKKTLWEMIYGVTPEFSPLGEDLSDRERQMWASRLTNAIWDGGMRNPGDIRRATDKTLMGLKGFGRQSLPMIRHLFPRKG